MKKIDLNKNWKFKIAKSSNGFEKYSSWMACEVPGTVHTDLLNLGLIEDPYYEDNERRLQWVSEQDWVYKTSFDLPDNFNSDTPINLVFEGVDTIAKAWLNEKLIGNFQNMFRAYDFEISKFLKTQNNLLEIRFYSPLNYAKEQEKKYGKLPVELNTERVYIRKAQYSFGWDWGPSFPTLGLWKPVYLVQHSKAYIQSVSFNTIELKDDTAEVEVDISICGSDLEDIGVEVGLELDEQNYREFSTSPKSDNKFRFQINSPKLWFPCCTGEQSLYNLKVELKILNGEQLDLVENKVGVRTVELKLNENDKSTFKFVINKKDIFIKGVNWIPADLFLPRVSAEEYLKLIMLAKDANCNMIRVWGGGVYEQNYFYELCDEHGILVWQDFMFVCGAYPEQEEFLDNIDKEIYQTVERLQHHPSIALWCGNNENEWIWYRDHNRDISIMPGYKIYHEIIPGILTKVDPRRPYWPSSPFGFDEDPNNQKSGSTHQWNIWSRWIDYNKVEEDNSLFVSEFGFQGPANINTLEKCLSPEHRKIQDEKFEFHNKQVEGQDRIFKFLSAHLPISTQWEDFIYLSQLNQGLALKRCIEHWRTNRPRTNGSIIWQLNDCWPVVSWSLVDSSYLPKLAYYFVKRAFAPVGILFKRENSNLKIYGLNQGSGSFKGYIKLAIISLVRGDVLYESTKEALLKENSYNPVINIPKAYQKNIDEYIYIVTLYSENDDLIIRNFYVANEWKHIQTPKPNIEIKKSQSKKKNEINITTDKPAFFVDLYHPQLSFSDRGFILLPGEEKTIQMSNQKKRTINFKDMEIFALNNYLSD
jgi:beta-mannosidase